jgi:hypothetical protein
MTIMKKILFTICVFTFVSCSSNNDFQKGKKQLEQQGYTDVKNTGYEVFCCGKDDTFSTGFEAKDKKQVKHDVDSKELMKKDYAYQDIINRR